MRLALLPLLSWLLASAAREVPRPPAQPAQGPGGSAYPHRSLEQTVYGAGGDEYWLFEPRSPRPERPAPLVVFLHGWSAPDPAAYGAWIAHLVRRGNVVCFPVYQDSLLTPPGAFLPNVVLAVRDALRHLDGDWHLALDRERVAFVGHSMGGLLAVNLAAVARAEGLPAPRALFVVQPGVSRTPLGDLQPLAELARIDAATRLCLVVGEDDGLTGDVDARAILAGCAGLPADARELLLLRSDGHGRPALTADHLAPFAHDGRIGSRSELVPLDAVRGGDDRLDGDPYDVDALDWLGLWRPLDEFLAAAGTDAARPIDLGMGRWSDGRSVRPLLRLE